MNRFFALFLAGITIIGATNCGDEPVSPQGTAIPANSPIPRTPEATAVSASPTPIGDTTELVEAAGAGDTRTVRDLLSRGAAVNAQDSRGRTAIMAASSGNHIEAAGLLLSAGADVNIKDDTQENAFSIAAINGHTGMLRLTIAAGADANSLNRFNGTALIAASDRGHVEVVRELLTTNIRVNHVNRLGWTALLEAVILGDGGSRHTEIVGLLVAAGADVNIADNQGVTPLHHARNRGYSAMASILERAGGR